MRVALLTHEPFYPPSGGGSAEALYLARELVRRGHAVTVFAPVSGVPADLAATGRVRLEPFTGWAMGRRTPLRTIKYLLYPGALARLVRRAAARERFDVLVAQHAIACVAAGRLKRPLRVPVVMNFLDHLTGFMETWPAWLMPPPVLAVLKRYELNLPRRFAADAVLTVSEPLADRFAATGYPRERLRPIFYGYDAEWFRFDPAQVEARGQAPPVVVMHGSFDHHHLGPIALDTVAQVHAERPDVVFEFIGPDTPAWRRFARRAAARGLAPALRHTGFVPYEAIAGRLGLATVGLVPYEESAGTHCAFVAKVVEYLALGLPVACTALEGLRRYFAGEPLIKFAAFNGAALGAAVLAWLAEPAAARARLAGPAARRVREELDWRVVCGRAADAIEIAHQRAAAAGANP
jgi:glycosyltransferase involved in cell wall biosynthesis